MSYTLPIVSFSLAFFLSAWTMGLGVQVLLGTGRRPEERTASGLLAIPTGIGVLALTLFVLAALGCLNTLCIGLAVATEVALSVYLLAKSQAAVNRQLLPTVWSCLQRNSFLLTCLALIAVPLFINALSAPLAWDEISYHLPYVREYIEHGGLTVADYLRFPLHSHNYQLLYAAALMFSSEVGAHVIHGFSGALVALGTYYLGREFFNRFIGLLAAVVYLVFANDMLDTAFVDLGLSLFAFYSFFSFAQWLKHRNDGFLWLSAFLLAVAAGTKYQALSLLPVFALMLLAVDRSPRRLFGYALILMLFGTWWYVRNFWISGDPVNPLGGRLFGYWAWDAFDLAGMRSHLSRINDPMPAYLYPALLSVFLVRRGKPVFNAMVFFALTGVVFWYFSSRYERYLLPLVPFLALLSLHMVWTIVAWPIPNKWRLPTPRSDSWLATVLLRVVPLVLLAAGSVHFINLERERVCFSDACITDTLRARTQTYKLWEEVPGFADLQLYQFGYENEIYYLGKPLGDWRGIYRYQHIFELEKDASLLREHLLGLQRDSILVHRKRYPFFEVLEDPELGNYFDTLYENDKLVLLKLKP